MPTGNTKIDEDISRIVSGRLVPGQVVRFTVLRGGTRREVVRVKLTERAVQGTP